MRFSPEQPATNRTREWTQIQVALHVTPQVLASGELSLAHIALKRPESGVYSNVNVQITLAGECFKACVARVRFDVAVYLVQLIIGVVVHIRHRSWVLLLLMAVHVGLRPFRHHLLLIGRIGAVLLAAPFNRRVARSQAVRSIGCLARFVARVQVRKGVVEQLRLENERLRTLGAL